MPDNIADVTISTAPGTRLDINSLDTAGPARRCRCRSPGRPPTTRSCSRIINRYGYTAERRSAWAAARSASAASSTTTTSSATRARSATTSRSARSVVHDLHVGYQLYADAEDLVRSSNGWGLITVPGGRQSFQGRPIFFQAAFQQQTTGLVAQDPLRVPLAELRAERHHQVEATGRSTSACSRARTRCTARGCARTPRRSPASSRAPGNKYEMYDIPFSKMIQPRVGRHLGLQRQGHRLRELRASTTRPPARCRAPPPGTATSRPPSTRYFDARRRALRDRPRGVLLGQAVRGGPDAAHGARVPGRAPRGRSGPDWSARLYGRYREGSHFWEDTNNNARVAFNPPAGIPRELYIPDLTARIAQIGSGSTYVIAELDGAFTRYYEATARDGVARRQDLRARLVHLEPLLRQLRPGQLDRSTTTSTSSSARRTSPTAPAASSGTSRTATCAATARTC